MSWAEDVWGALKKIVLIEERLAALNEEVRHLSARQADMNERLARLEGKFELLERMGAARGKRLPPT